MAKPLEKIKYRGATYVLAEPPKQITYRGAQYVLAAQPKMTEEERKQAEEALDKAGYGNEVAHYKSYAPKATHIANSLMQSVSSFQSTLSKAASAADKAAMQGKGGAKKIFDAGYDSFLQSMLNDPERTMNILNNFSDEMAKSFVFFDLAAEFRDLIEKAAFAEGFLDPQTFSDVYNSNKSDPQVGGSYDGEKRFIDKNWPSRPLSS